jgi:PAS domain S-box-containing protein
VDIQGRVGDGVGTRGRGGFRPTNSASARRVVSEPSGRLHSGWRMGAGREHPPGFFRSAGPCDDRAVRTMTRAHRSPNGPRAGSRAFNGSLAQPGATDATPRLHAMVVGLNGPTMAFLAARLRKLGFSVERVGGLLEATGADGRCVADLLLFDWSMFDGEASSGAEELRRASTGLVVAVAAEEEAEAAMEALGSGVDDVIRWPVDQSEADLRLRVLQQRIAPSQVQSEPPKEMSDDTDLLRRALSSITDAVCVIDIETYRVVLANDGGTVGELGGARHCYELAHARSTPCEGEDHPCPLAEIRTTLRPAVTEHLHGPEHGKRAVEVRAYPILNSQDRVTHIVEYCVDISERKRAEARIQANQRRLERSVHDRTTELEALRSFSDEILGTMSEGMALIDSEGRFEYVNSALARLLDQDPDGLIGKAIGDVLPAAAAEAVTSPVARATEVFEPRDATFALTTGLGTRSVEASVSTQDRSIGSRTSFVALFRDVTDQLLFQQRSQQARKMEALGLFAASIAHDFNGLLMIIQGSLDLLHLGRMREPSELESLVEAIGRATESASKLTRSLLAFSRQQIVSAVETNLSELIEGTLPMLRRLLPEDIGIQYVPFEGLHDVKCDRTDIQQVLLNFCSNSADAMPEGGVITIHTGNIEIGDEYVGDNPWAVPGDYVFFSVTDTGIGMDEPTLARALDPFFTTKGPEKGTGLGLSSAYGSLKRHGGMIEIASEPGTGTSCIAYLPVSDSPAGVSQPQEDHLPGGSETLLVVDDSDDLRHVMSGLLESLGYRVLTATGGDDALRLLAADSPQIDLVVADLLMPRMSGLELCERSRELNPELRFLYCSGKSELWLAFDKASRKGASFVGKPCGIETLSKAIREILDRCPGCSEELP